jgi:phosphate-selective porin OprO/OprP
VGLNYYLGKDIQLRLNYLMPEISGNRLSPDPGGNAATLRLVYRF